MAPRRPRAAEEPTVPPIAVDPAACGGTSPGEEPRGAPPAPPRGARLPVGRSSRRCSALGTGGSADLREFPVGARGRRALRGAERRLGRDDPAVHDRVRHRLQGAGQPRQGFRACRLPVDRVGCNYGTCTRHPVPAPALRPRGRPLQLGGHRPRRGRFNVAYDIWLDPTPRRDGDNTGAELMIWLVRAGVRPDRLQGATDVDRRRRLGRLPGRERGPPGDLLRPRAVRRQVLDLPITDFVRDATRQGV